jgi:hypothetical protein
MRVPLRFTLVAFAFFLLASSLCGQEHEEKPGEIRITRYEIFEQDFEKPLIRLDERGAPQSYNHAYIVHLKGDFGKHGAIPVDVFIGDYIVPEYGGTSEGIYFRIYEEKLLEKLAGLPFSYGFEGQKVKTTAVRFLPASLRPFKKITKFP